jgi:hypothetical protein
MAASPAASMHTSEIVEREMRTNTMRLFAYQKVTRQRAVPIPALLAQKEVLENENARKESPGRTFLHQEYTTAVNLFRSPRKAACAKLISFALCLDIDWKYRDASHRLRPRYFALSLYRSSFR